MKVEPIKEMPAACAAHTAPSRSLKGLRKKAVKKT
jgi:hypothetical protein